ncbi:MAG: DMT family transporter [Balneolaceae bacterium]|nr:MAG: DMT family transporter [Balneolaceae bacterium]
MKSILNTTWFLAIGFVLFWNSGFIGADYALPYAEPFALLFWRYWPLTLILLGWLAVRGRLRWPGRSAVLTAMVIGILAHGVWLGCVLFSLLYGVPAGIVALVVALQPMATGALSGSVTGERTPLPRWFGLIIGFIGVMVAVLFRTDFTDPQSVFAYFIPFGSVIAITGASLFQRRMEIHRHTNRIPVDLALFYQCLGTALVVTIPAIAIDNLSAVWVPEFIATMIWLIVGVSLAAYALMWMLIARMDATRVASLFYLGPPVTMLMAWIAFGDKVLMTDILGLGVVAVGVLLSQKRVP